MDFKRKYLTNKEFTKNIRYNGNNYLLRSIFDTNNSKFDFDATIAKYKDNKWNFDITIQNYQHKLFDLSDDLTNLYNTGLFEHKKIFKRK